MNSTASLCSDQFNYWNRKFDWTASRTQSKIDSYCSEIRKLDDEDYFIKDPVQIFVKKEGDEFIGEIQDIETYAFGETEKDVLSELKADLVDLFEHYANSIDDRLGKKPLKWKTFLLAHIQKK